MVSQTTALIVLPPESFGLSVVFIAVMAVLYTRSCLCILERGCFISSSFDVADSFGSFAPSVHDTCRVLIATSL